MMRWNLLVLLVSVFTATACGGAGPTAGGDSSWMKAVIQGSSAVTYQGTGSYGMDYMPRTFVLTSSGTGSATGQSFVLRRRQEAETPGTGDYPIATPGAVGASADAFEVVYSRIDRGGHESFVAQSGAVVITRSSPDRVEGTFRFSAVPSCARIPSSGPTGTCGVAYASGAPALEVHGSFVATPLEAVAEPASR